MKKIGFLLAVIGLIFTGCDPLEDINTDLDNQEDPIVANVEYTLVADDYAALELDFGNFSSVEDAKVMLPAFLADKYPYYGQGSSALIGYDLFIGSAEGVSDYTNADVYSFTNADYAATGSDAFGFYPDVDAEEEIPAVLADQIESPEEGQIVLAEYKQYTETPVVGLATIYDGAFPDVFGDFENIDLLGDQGWSEGSSYANGSGYNGENNDNEDWLISPEIDLAGQTNLQFQINQRISFLGDGVLTEHVNILVATDYTTGSDLMDATWEVITLENIPDGSNSDFVLSEAYDFSAYQDETIHIAFRLQTTVAVSPLWRIDFFTIKALGVEGNTDSRGSFFVYEGGSWETSEGVYYLSKSDYDSMGEESGQPGRFDNFSSSVSADNYLPAFLNLKYPFAQEEDEIFVIYKYFSSNSGLGTRGNLYTFSNSVWTGYESTIATSLQFGFEDGVWVPDNTIRYTLVGSDYEAVVAGLTGVEGFEDVVANLDSFGNFNRTDGNWTDEMLITALDIVLDNLDPSAEDGQKYVLTIATWAPGNSTEEWAMIKNEGEWVTQASLED